MGCCSFHVSWVLTGAHRSNFVCGGIRKVPTCNLSPGHLRASVLPEDIWRKWQQIVVHVVFKRLWVMGAPVNKLWKAILACSHTGLLTIKTPSPIMNTCIQLNGRRDWMGDLSDVSIDIVNRGVLFKLATLIGCDDKEMCSLKNPHIAFFLHGCGVAWLIPNYTMPLSSIWAYGIF